jgi:hypothetical protein
MELPEILDFLLNAKRAQDVRAYSVLDTMVQALQLHNETCKQNKCGFRDKFVDIQQAVGQRLELIRTTRKTLGKWPDASDVLCMLQVFEMQYQLQPESFGGLIPLSPPTLESLEFVGPAGCRILMDHLLVEHLVQAHIVDGFMRELALVPKLHAFVQYYGSHAVDIKRRIYDRAWREAFVCSRYLYRICPMITLVSYIRMRGVLNDYTVPDALLKLLPEKVSRDELYRVLSLFKDLDPRRINENSLH